MLFNRKKYITLGHKEKKMAGGPKIPDGNWLKCNGCKKAVYHKEVTSTKNCPHCGYCFRLTAWERIEFIADKGSFKEFNQTLKTKNPMNFPNYEERVKLIQRKTGLTEGIVTGICTIQGQQTALCVMDSRFIMGSMGSVVGEKVTRIFEQATQEKLPVIIFTASGGARMQEGIISLMQMAKVSSAVARHSEMGLLYISVITDPTTGGVTASFAMLGDIILAEPGALIGFAGRRVIEQTIKEKLPEGFQSAEFALEHGQIDKIVPRDELQRVLSDLLTMHS